jgi:hypothetical protein
MSNSMEYKIHFTLTIRSLDKTKATTGYKKMVLPFVPFLGMRLEEKLGLSEPIVSISWSNEEQEFYCHIDSSEIEMDDGFDLDMDFLIDQARKNKWLKIGNVHEVNS